MDIEKILEELRLERMQIEEAILSLERLAKDRVKRRGRPPKWVAEAKKRVKAQARKQQDSSKTAAA
ncbi:MAG: hypothetical protein K6T61_05420 [Bryobacteraceae bacterium]|jgi:hypothetical protein|nr:hypothetical protein [Bryobacteraceae bacterium]